MSIFVDAVFFGFMHMLWANIGKKEIPSSKMFTHFLRKFRFNFILVSFNFIRKMRNKCVIKCLENNPDVTNFAS